MPSFPEGLEENASLPFPASGGCLFLGPLAGRQQSHQSSMCFQGDTSSASRLQGQPWLTETHPDDPGNSPNHKIFTLFTSARSLVPYQVAHSQISGIRIWTTLGDLFILPAIATPCKGASSTKALSLLHLTCCYLHAYCSFTS